MVNFWLQNCTYLIRAPIHRKITDLAPPPPLGIFWTSHCCWYYAIIYGAALQKVGDVGLPAQIPTGLAIWVVGRKTLNWCTPFFM